MTQKADLWQRGKQWPSLSEIGRALVKHAGSIHGVRSSNDGVVPPVRTESRWTLTLGEREMISRGLGACPTLTVLLRRTICDLLRRARLGKILNVFQ
ncbi:MAG: hypothetical protein SGJ26_20090, partial [Nitrospirota bacterium]|nr:hypothetical protein [Nitrospirota bacterium]